MCQQWRLLKCDCVSDLFPSGKFFAIIFFFLVKTFAYAYPRRSVLNAAYSTYRPDEIFLSFNGGKDCTVLLDIIMKLLPTIVSSGDLKCVYMQPKEPFEEVEEFIDHCRRYYNIKIRSMRGDIRTILNKICEEDHKIKACLMGSRQTDPYCENLKSMQETDPGWPKMMRINPMLNWSCSDIWEYIQKNDVPYCSLYDRGYTSIGDKTNTIPNPNLKRTGKSGEMIYIAAYQLQHDKLERAGRL
ncbi:FAD synthase-like isoform X3 [Ochlerotatus camptorhynchus]|uniref:FAD synthase-like isoform X3 n=1 Tax=Ochlerotatus camptorhynchus TaxID=644619 RepID=UPI0031CFA49F